MEPTDRGPKTAASPGKSPRPRLRPIDLRRVARGAEERLGQRVTGQPGAVRSVARALRRAATGLSGGRGPLATLCFVGPTGTGKTELARALAEELGGAQRLVRIDCGEFGSGHETSKLLGAPPGYVGHELGSSLARRMGGGECVVLFDEVEKAHPKLHELLLHVLDEGRLTDGRGVELDFRRAFVILTSNSGTRELLAARERVGFGRGGLAEESARATVQVALDSSFSPEFLARLDEIVMFRELSSESLRTVATRRLLDLALRVRSGGRRVCFTAAVARWAAGRATEGTQGARGLLHLVKREIEAPLAEVLLAAEEGEWIEVSIRRGRPHFAHAA